MEKSGEKLTSLNGLMALQVEIGDRRVRDRRVNHESRGAIVGVSCSETKSAVVGTYMNVCTYPGGKKTAWCLIKILRMKIRETRGFLTVLLL